MEENGESDGSEEEETEAGSAKDHNVDEARGEGPELVRDALPCACTAKAEAKRRKDVLLWLKNGECADCDALPVQQKQTHPPGSIKT